MGPRRSEDSWLEDFSILLRPDAIRSMRRKPEFDVFTGSKVSAGLWIAAVAALAGAVGGMLAGPELLTRVWPTFVGLLVVGPALWVATDRSTRAVFGAQIAYRDGPSSSDRLSPHCPSGAPSCHQLVGGMVSLLE
jgi:hypothetical protein